jgi:hypothetical protein
MPYIDYEQRRKYEILLQSLTEQLLSTKSGFAGDTNFVISSLFERLWRNAPCQDYKTLNTFMGILECAKLEFYRRVVANYEDTKINQNGDIFESPTGENKP